MVKLKIPDMSCGHCAGVITKAIKALDADAGIEFDMPQHLALVNSAAAVNTLLASLESAGYPATVED